jgi:acetyl esterase
MGGNFAAIIAQEMARKGEPAPAAQILIYPAVDVASETPSMTTYADAYPLTRRDHGLVHGPLYGPRRRPGRPAPVAGQDRWTCRACPRR